MRVSPYVRLTIWYVAILMGLSLAFSVWVYNETMAELKAGFTGPVVERLQNRYGPLPAEVWVQVIEKQFEVSRQRVIGQLIVLNVGVLVVGAGASYWLARRTMRPIEEAFEAQNRFTADASHELRTPLSAMKTEIEVSLRDPNLDKQEMRELLRSNLEEIDRLSELAQGLLTLARQPEKPQVAPLAVKPVVIEIMKRYKPLADAKQIAFKKEFNEINVMADKKNLALLIGILLDNAIKYSPEKTTITVRVERKDGHGLISVIDQGPGISTDDLPRIFERFFRADSSRTKEQVAGNGLGLSIAKKTAAALHGAIIAKSEKGQGSTFSIRLPITPLAKP
jgi:two-component system, OmpR family, sensor histidine kinase CiaH